MKEILNRRSIRKYKDKKVPWEMIKKLLQAAMAAPTAGNAQHWEFVVIDDKKVLNKIPEVHPYSKFIEGASHAIIVCANPEKEVHKGFWVQDCSAATENILIEAQYLGIGAVWLGVYPEESRYKGIQKLLNTPEVIIPFSIVAIGYSDEDKLEENRYNEEKIHLNEW